MPLLPSHLGRALQAVGGRISEDGDHPIASLEEIRARMGDPPPSGQLKEWLSDLVEQGLLEAGYNGWRVTDNGWRALNVVPDSLE